MRRTDKVQHEAALHTLEEYMGPVEEFFTQLEMNHKLDKRRIFIASDDPTVIEEAKKKYGVQYNILKEGSWSTFIMLLLFNITIQYPLHIFLNWRSSC